MPRKNVNSNGPKREVTERCPECKGTGEVIETQTFMKPHGTDDIFARSGEVAGRRDVKRKCIRCGGRGKITFYVDREIA